MPTISIGPNSAGACSSRVRPAATRSAGRIIAGGSASRTATSRLAIDWRRGCSPARAWRSTPARHALRRVSAAAPTIPASPLIPSNSPSAVAGRTAVMASLSASSSTGLRTSPPASRAASSSKVMICSPCRRLARSLQPQLPHPQQAVGNDLFGVLLQLRHSHQPCQRHGHSARVVVHREMEYIPAHTDKLINTDMFHSL